MPEGRGSLEERLAVVEERLRDLRAIVNGGDGVTWDQSLRGRLHGLANAQASAEALAHAAHELRRAHEQNTKRRQWVVGIVFAAAAVVPPWVLLIVTYWP